VTETSSQQPQFLGLPEGVRFIGREPGAQPAWPFPDAPTDQDITTCVACGLCLPHCPTWRLTGEEQHSPRGRIAAMRAVAEGRGQVDEAFAEFTDLCLSCRACEHVCPSDVPFGRLMEHARTQVEPLRPARQRLLRWLGLEVALPRGWMVTLATVLTPVARPLLPRRVRALLPRVRLRDLTSRLPRVTDPPPDALVGGAPRGTVAILSGCVQDRWYREANRATIRVLTRAGWRVAVPEQNCCGALPAHYGRLSRARKLARDTVRALGDADWVVVNGAGCGAHLKDFGELIGAEDFSAKVRDFMEFLDEHGLRPRDTSPQEAAAVAPPVPDPAAMSPETGEDPARAAREEPREEPRPKRQEEPERQRQKEGRPEAGGQPLKVALHDPCHLLHAQQIAQAPRNVLAQVPGVEVCEVRDGDRCCGAAGLYNVLEPEMADELMRQKAANIDATGARMVVVGNPGCAMQIQAGLAARDSKVQVVNPAELLDRAARGSLRPDAG
jgi:glycolate oxidase iron-sulfur subunit